jgi:hypothetical protein
MYEHMNKTYLPQKQSCTCPSLQLCINSSGPDKSGWEAQAGQALPEGVGERGRVEAPGLSPPGRLALATPMPTALLARNLAL